MAGSFVLLKIFPLFNFGIYLYCVIELSDAAFLVYLMLKCLLYQ